MTRRQQRGPSGQDPAQQDQVLQRDRARQQHPKNPGADDQSGSTGRSPDTSNTDSSKDTGQDNYGQSGFAGEDKGEKPKP